MHVGSIASDDCCTIQKRGRLLRFEGKETEYCMFFIADTFFVLSTEITNWLLDKVV